MPVMPTSTPIQSPKRTIAGSIGSFSVAGNPHGVLLDFLDLAGRECGVREDNGVSVVARDLSPLLRRAPLAATASTSRSATARSSPWSAPPAAASRPCWRSSAGCASRARARSRSSGDDRAPRGASPTAPTCPKATCSCRGSRRSTTRRWRSATAASARPRRGPRRAPCSSASASPASRAPRPQELSGGMRQRVAFLRTLVAGKPVLALDEPFAALDAISRGEMQEWLAGALRAEAKTVLLVSHDIEEALYLADRVVVMSPRPGRIVTELTSAAPARRRPRRRRHRSRPSSPSARQRCARSARAPGDAPGAPRGAFSSPRR